MENITSSCTLTTMTLYLTYRPQTIADLDLANVRREISKIAANLDMAPHAFLFSGPRGTGKTSAARILAKVLNCEHLVKTENGVEPCNKCAQCKAISNGQSMDVIEIDTASNRGIDDIRALRETVALSPVSARKKVYIMDEAHMLTLEAANAFLKTLEEPPAHAVFILATTDPLKLPVTVRSRLANVTFTKATAEEIHGQLNRVLAGEHVTVEDGVLDLVAKKADGSFRDAVKILENLSLGKNNVTKADAESYLFSTNLVDAKDLLESILARDLTSSLEKVSKFAHLGGTIRDLLDQLEEDVRLRLLDTPSTDLVHLARLIMDARGALPKTAIPELPLELSIIEFCGYDHELLKKKEPLTETQTPVSQTVAMEPEEARALPSAIESTGSQSLDSGVWAKILAGAKNKNVSLEALLRSSKPKGLDGNTLNLAVYYSFHKERLEIEQYRSILESVITEVTGVDNPRIKCFLEEPPAPLTKAEAPDILKAAKEIFGE